MENSKNYVFLFILKFQDNWHRKLVWFDKRKPSITEELFIAPNATVIGDVVLMNNSSVWYGAVLRGDLTKITIGAYTNIQDGAVITTSDEKNIGDFDPEVVIGSYTTIGKKKLKN
jgi:gamma-carbonic anhydrase